MKRCFIAMAIAASTREALALVRDELDALPRSAARRLRPVASANLHVTVRFLGDTPDAQIPDVTAAMTEVAARHARAQAMVEGVGAFPSPMRPRVLFAALGRGREAVTDLCVDIERALVPLGFDAERRAPHPHVTLARVEGARARGPITEWLEETPRSFGPVQDDALVLYQSTLTPRGAIYRPLASAPVAAP